jgi:hypothetical protein
MPTEGRALTSMAISATLHCLTGCAIGEVLGVAIGTALGWTDFQTIALAVGLAFLFGYGLTSLPLLRAGLALSVVVPVALATDTLSIATMELVDNGVLLIVPGAMEAGLDSLLFWGSLSFALAVAFVATVPVNRYLLKIGKGHTAVHETGIHGGPPTRYVAIAISAAALFGAAVVIAEAFDGDESGHGGMADSMQSGGHEGGKKDHATNAGADPVRGLSASAGGNTLALVATSAPLGRTQDIKFEILGEDKRPVIDFEVEHEKRLHLIVAKSDLSSFQHLHPHMSQDGTWSTPLRLDEPGEYRVFADFKREGENRTLAQTMTVKGPNETRSLPAPTNTATTEDGYEVRIDGASQAGAESELRFTPTLDGKPVAVEPYLGADGHLVALREKDLAYLHVHPKGDAGGHGAGEEARHAEKARGAESEIAFATEFPTEARYRLFLQFKHQGKVRTAAFTRQAGGR